MQNRRSRIIWFVAIAIAFFFILDPFRLFESNNVPQMRVNQELEQEMQQYLISSPEATQYVVESLESHDLVMIGETGYIKEQLEFLADLIPALDEAGIRHLGFQYANADQQDMIDTLLTGTSFDEDLANRILFEHMVIMGYEEHRNVFRAAWQVNRSKAEGEEPFRIVGIGYTPDYSQIQAEEDVEDPEVLQKVLANGIPDEVMARTIMDELVRPGHKAVVYTRLQHAFTEFEQPQYTEQMRESGFPNQHRTGVILATELGDRVMTAMFHMPLQDTRSRFGYGYPIGGVMERALEALPEGERRPGFSVAESPYADAPITSDVFTEGRDDDLMLQQITDGYLLISRIVDYTAVTPIPDFITEENIGRARAEFPGADPGDVPVAEMNEYIAGTASSMTRILDEFDD